MLDVYGVFRNPKALSPRYVHTFYTVAVCMCMEDLRWQGEVAEHVLRISSDFSLASEVLLNIDSKPELSASVGRLVSESNRPLRTKTPLASLLDGSKVAVDWRSMVQNVPSSLWSELEMMRSIYGASCPAEVIPSQAGPGSLHPLLSEIVSLRTFADTDLMGLG